MSSDSKMLTVDILSPACDLVSVEMHEVEQAPQKFVHILQIWEDITVCSYLWSTFWELSSDCN